MTTAARTRSTKKYKALIEIGKSDTEALAILLPNPESATTPSDIDKLVKAGFSPEDAATAVAAHPAKSAEEKPKQVEADALVASQGLKPTRGRVYYTGSILEAAATVLKTGSPQVVKTAGVGHTKAVLIFVTDAGGPAIQNLVPQD
jgi:hypothetical protein